MTNLDGNQRYRVKTEGVASKIFDHEAIIINLNTAIYYSLDGFGCAIWVHLDAGCSPLAIAKRLAEETDVGIDAIRADVAALVTELSEEGLIEADNVPAEENAPPVDVPTASYAAPALHRYDDMQDLLALDPPLLEANEA
jgi:hypothetical protein